MIIMLFGGKEVQLVSKNDLERAKKHPEIFAQLFFKFKPHWYQVEMLKAIAKGWDTVICCSRQIGKSMAVAMGVVWFAVTKEDTVSLILSYSKLQAQELYHKIKSLIFYHPQLEALIDKDTMSETRFINGSRILIRPVGKGGLSAQGYSADLLVIDEADSLPDEIFGVVTATQASTGGATILISTPRRKGSIFYRTFQDAMEARKEYEKGLRKQPYRDVEEGGTGFVGFHYDYTVGLNTYKANGKPQISMKVIQREKRTKPKWQFDAEYRAIWSDDSASYFSHQMILDAVEEYPMLKHPIPDKRYYMGVDLAKYQDKTVVIVVEETLPNKYRVVYIYSTGNRNWKEQVGELELIAERFKPERIFIDRNSIGDVVLDWLESNPNNALYNKIDGRTFSIQSKIAMYSNLYRLFSLKMLTIPKHKELMDELMFLQYEKTPMSELIKIHAPNGGFDDHCDALALACLFTEDIPIDEISIAVLSQMRRDNKKYFNKSKNESNEEFTFKDLNYQSKRKNRDMFNRGLRTNKRYF